ncbi:MAG: phytanoyl-CoA dioxygenase family protein [Chloroflexi bacterium]|nr:phytanoyl-CoA dioxygenase family protein [Chloroflexota bacterium]
MIEEQSLQRLHQPYQVSVDEYKAFRRDGYLVLRGLVAPDEVRQLAAYTEDLMAGRATLPGVPPPADDASDRERRLHYERVHMPHRTEEIAERFLLHPRVVDVLEALIGPDVLGLQTMLFFKQPGQAGQGFHQDSYYIPTQPDTLIGAWIAIDPANEDNGCLWITPGSQHEPIYPDCDGVTQQGDTILNDIESIINASHPDVEKNTLAKIALRYETEVAIPAQPGDVVFFGGHVLHRSHHNDSDKPRRAFVSHYCNARSRVPWNHRGAYDGDEQGAAANYMHILARGATHLPYAQPRFGTLCAANAPELYGHRVDNHRVKSMMGDGNGFMVVVPHEDVDHDH